MFDSIQLHATLPASDLDRAMSWYAEKLGLKPTEVDETNSNAWYESGGSQFLVYASAFAGTNEATSASFRVEDFDAALARLREGGVVFEEYDFEDFKTVDGVATTEDGSKVAWFKDSEGNILAISNL